MTRQEYTALVDRAKQLSYEYYVLAAPSVSDAQFDALVGEIEQAESEHPEWTLPDSPTQQVGSDLQDNGRRLVRHRTRMLSCQKAQTQEAVTKWLTQTEKKLKGAQVYALEWKYDGISCSLVYQDGRLISAATRGDKDCGQDLLAHVMRMPSVPQHINMTGRVEVRGEVVCPKAELAALGYKDCRTAAAALTNQAVPSYEVEHLVFLAWQMDSDEQPFGTESVSIVAAQQQGFQCDVRTCDGADVCKMLDEYSEIRELLPYPTDGVVIKIDNKPLAASLGYTEHHPKGNIAYKFGAQKTVTRVLRIEVNVGATGKRTPVAYLEPVMIMGREVKQASLYSERKMTELGVTEGCLVEVGLSNDVTPKIYRVIDTGDETATDNESEKNVIEENTDGTDYTDSETCEPTAVNPEPFARPEGTLANARTMNQQRPRKPRKPRVERQPSAISPQPSATLKAVGIREQEVCDRSERQCHHQQQENHRQQRRERQRNEEPEWKRKLDEQWRKNHPAMTAAEYYRNGGQLTATASNGHEWLKLAGYAAAASVALLVIWQTGLIIPLGLIGLATGGILK